MNKYEFNHDGTTTFEALGISDERRDEIIEVLTSVVTRAVFTDHLINSTSKALEVLVNETQPSTFVEAMAIGYRYALAHQSAVKVAKSMFPEIKP
jgi:hypothetical protein